MSIYDASSSDSIYDVFLSFRGRTRYGFTNHLYGTLRRYGINTFRDDEKLRIGDEIRPALLKAIEKSRMSIVVLCENYASSTWCLDELVKIMECHDKKGKHVSTIFYKVEPTNVRYQKHSYAAAMIKHERRFGRNSRKVKAWKSALYRVCDLSGGRHCRDNMYESELIYKIVEDALAKLPPMPFQIKHPLRYDYRIEEVKSLLDIGNDTVCMFGIYGPSGKGKTTFVVNLYNKIRHQFEAASFLGDIREKSKKNINGLVDLQKTLLSEMGEETGTMMGSTFRGGS